MKGSCLPILSWLLLAGTGCLAQRSGLAETHGLARRGVDNPGPENFIRYRYPTVVTLGNYVYIDGGELSQKENGTVATNSTQSGQTYPSYAVNSTLSLNLSESWTNETARFQVIPKTAPLLDQQIYWSDASTNGFYTWGGMAVGSESPPANELWLFNADGAGAGTWAQVTQGDFRDFSQLYRPVGASFTQSGHVGYAFGGQATSQTDRSIQKPYPGYALPGLVSYNFQTGDWTNTSTSKYQGYGTSVNGRAEYVPFGSDGLLLFFAGAETPIDIIEDSTVQINWNKVTLFNPITGKWYTQETSGMRPQLVERACSVGVRGPNSTYEIYLYGGTSIQLGGTSSDVYVLSLPGFVFFKSQMQGTPRADHACAVVGNGKRQMLSFGGVDGGPELQSSLTTPDPWKQGLGIYDMSEMTWKDSYDPDAADYETPNVVMEWYRNGGMENISWDSNEVKGLFFNSSSATIGAGVNSTDGSSGNSSRKTGIIAGSTVGGVVVLAIVGGVVFSLIRRKRRNQYRRPSTTTEIISEYRPEPWPKDSPRLRSVTPGTMVSSPTPTEPIEISGTAREELPAEDVGWTYELPAHTPNMRSELPDRNF